MGCRLLIFIVLIVAGCTSADKTSAPSVEPVASAPSDDTESRVTDGSTPSAGGPDMFADQPIEEIVAQIAAPEIVDAAAERSCERYGYVCSLGLATDDQVDAGVAALGSIRTAMKASDDAREQMRLAVAAAAGLDGVGHLEIDADHSTQMTFTIDDGPRFVVLTDAALLNDDPDVPAVARPVEPLQPLGDAATDEPGAGAEPETEGGAEPNGLVGPLQSARPIGLRAASPVVRRYEPTGGALAQRSALVLNPFGWDSATAIAALFEAEEEYSTVSVLVGPEVTPDVLLSVPDYDAVHILSHGGGSCPTWTEDRSECVSTIVGGEWDKGIQKQIKAQFDAAEQEIGASVDELAGVAYWLCESSGVIRYCFNSDGFPSNPNGVTFFGACGSDFGFGGSNGGGGATVTWTGTTQRLVAERTAAEFWRLMVVEGVEFEVAAKLLADGGYDDHKLTWWASAGSVNMFTSAAFSGRNLRARDVVDATFDGDPLQGQLAKITGTPNDSDDEQFPRDGQKLAFVLEGVRTGTEQGVGFEVRGDGSVWKSDIELVRDGTIIEQGDGYATWRVDVNENAITVPALSLSDLASDRPPTLIEVRAFETEDEFTAVRGEIRFGADVVANGTLPIFDTLEAGMPAAGGQLVGNDLEVAFNTGGGVLTGRLEVEAFGQGLLIGEWTLDIDGSFDAVSGDVVGDVTATAQSRIPGFSQFGDFGTGQTTGTVDLAAGTVTLTIRAGDATQNYVGTIVT